MGKKIGGSNLDISYSIKSDAAGNIYTIGTFKDTVDFDPGVSVDYLISAGNSDIFITKLDVSGNYDWTYQIGAVSSDEGRSIFLDGLGNIYATGRFGASIDFDAGVGIFNLTATNYDVFILKLDTSGSFVFAKSVEGGASSLATGVSIAVDQSGNIYTSGGFTKTCDFDPGPGIFNLYALYTAFVFNLKLDISGNFLWAYSIGESSAASLMSLTADPAGNVYATGYFYGNVDFDPGAGIFTLSTDHTDLYGDVFVAKYSTTGNLLWAKKMGGTGNDVATSIAIDANGNVYTVGRFQGTADFNPGSATYNLVASTPGSDIFVSKLNASGKFVWARNIGDASTSETTLSLTLDPTGKLIIAGNGFLPSVGDHIFLKKISSAGTLEWYNIYEESFLDRVNAITADDNGNIYFTGIFRDTLDFDPGTGIYNLVAVSSSYDAFVSKLDGVGNFIWAKQFSGAGLDHASVIETDATGNILVGGYFEQTTDFDSGIGIYNLSVTGTRDIFILKLENDGDFIWAKQIGGFLDVYIRSIEVDHPGNIYILGVFNSANVDFDPGQGIFNLSPTGLNDGFVSKLDASGNFVWAQVIGSENEEVYAITLDASTNIYIGGTFIGTGDFDPGVGVANLTATGYPDMFIQKISQCVLPSAIITPVGSTTFCVGQSVLLNTNSGTGLTYQWKRNGVSISGATTSSYIATTPGKYTVYVSDLSPCTSVSNSISVNVPCIPIGPNHDRTILNSEFESPPLQIFPNPGSGLFTVESASGQLQVFNSIGSLILSVALFDGVNTFDISKFSDGIYFVTIKTGESVHSQKVIMRR
ncbi:MAG: SBBP repeat-containing protein [Bacteroidetes bacterium]|nr:SBBP repeat-containing protein [Bacteroidota bacterium]